MVRHGPGRILVAAGGGLEAGHRLKMQIPREPVHPLLGGQGGRRRRPVERQCAVRCGWALVAHRSYASGFVAGSGLGTESSLEYERTTFPAASRMSSVTAPGASEAR